MACEADDWLGEESTPIGVGLALLEEGVEGLDRGDGELGLSAPSEGKAGVTRGAVAREAVLQTVQQLAPRGWSTRRAVGGASERVLDLDAGAVGGELPVGN
ncbi:hypothetical protein GCM10020254_40180 [Streptomyces goshikiensis]